MNDQPNRYWLRFWIAAALLLACAYLWQSYQVSQVQARADQWARMFDKCRNMNQPEQQP